MINPAIFKAYDIRGIYPDEINEEAAYHIAQSYAAFIKPRTVVLGRDVRISSPSLWVAAKNGFVDAGVHVIDISAVSTDMMYFAVAHYGYDGGLTISASHNPKEYNGIKMVRRDAVPIAGDSGIEDMKAWVLAGNTLIAPKKGVVIQKYILDDYADKVLSFLLKPLTKSYHIVANANFGMSGIALRNMIHRGNLPITLTEIDFNPDGNFPKGRPDPLIEERRKETEETIRTTNADFGIAWDADADRFFLYDEHGRAIEGYFITALLAKYFLEKYPGSTILSDARMTWAIRDIVNEYKGTYILNRAGHSFIKESMRAHNVIFGGEMSGHFYFKDFFFCDNGMVPLMIILQLMESAESMSGLCNDLLSKYFISGEIDVPVKNPSMIIDLVKSHYSNQATLDETDGISLESKDWRFNLRASNTEPLIRLNVESMDSQITKQMTDEVLAMVNANKDIEG